MSTNPENQNPTFVQKAQSFAELTVKSAAAAITGQEVFVSEEKENARLELCHSCEEYDAASESCNKCGCNIPMKVKFNAAYCPIGKWTGCPTIHG